MTPQWKKRLAREWLTLVGCLLIGFLLPLLLRVLVGIFVYIPSTIGEDCGAFLEALFTPGDRGLWLVVFGPYITCQLVRSIVWAVKVLRAPSDSLKRI
jgi:hypothetical protein